MTTTVLLVQVMHALKPENLDLYEVVPGSADHVRLLREMQATAVLRAALPPHPNVLPLLAVTVAPDGTISGLIEERMAVYDLRQRIVSELAEHGSVDGVTVFSWLADMAAAVQHLHSCPSGPVLHRDVFLSTLHVRRDVCADGREEERVVLGDFGECKQLTASAPRAMTPTGRPVVVAPEMLNHLGTGYDCSSDVYSWGRTVLLLALLALPGPEGEAPLHEGDVYDSVTFGNEARAEARASRAVGSLGAFRPSFAVLVQRCCRQNPGERPTMAEVSAAASVVRVQCFGACCHRHCSPRACWIRAVRDLWHLHLTDCGVAPAEAGVDHRGAARQRSFLSTANPTWKPK